MSVCNTRGLKARLVCFVRVRSGKMAEILRDTIIVIIMGGLFFFIFFFYISTRFFPEISGALRSHS